MKKLFIIILSIIMCFSIIACNDNKEDTESIEDKVKEAVRLRITTEIILYYDTADVPQCTYYVDDIGDNNFKVTGKATVKDKYGDSYTGKYDAEVTYDPFADKCSVTNLDLDKLYKD